MPMTTTAHPLQILTLFLLIIVAFFAGLARRIHVPYPILLVLAGLGISFIPHVPRIPLRPDLVFTIFLPPLLYAAAWQTNWRDFRRNLGSITMLAVGLISFSVLGLAFFAEHFIPVLDFRSGFLLGAVVAATDAVAATSIARNLGLAPRIVAILQGESLVNDATSLLALEFGLAMLLTGTPPSFTTGLVRFLWLCVGGIGIGLLIGLIAAFVERWIEGGPLEMAVSLIVPYVAYLATEQLHASGVLAVVACGLFLSRQSVNYLSAPARLELLGAWRALDFILNGIVFLLIGLQLPYILAGIHPSSMWALLLYGLLFSVVLIALRMIWVFAGSQSTFWLQRHFSRQPATPPSPKGLFVIGWTGMRGVVSLAAAYSLPFTLANGRPFAQRNLIIFLTFCIIFTTLVLQGLSLAPLIRILGLAGNREVEEEELQARNRLLHLTIDFLKHQRENVSEEERHDIDDLLHRYSHRLDALLNTSDGSREESAGRHHRRRELFRNTVQFERQTLLDMREHDLIGDEVLRKLERDLDLAEIRYSSFV